MKVNQLPNKLIAYLKNVRAELKRVTWPTRQETIKYTATVITFTLFVAFLLGGLDFLFSWLLNKFVI